MFGKRDLAEDSLRFDSVIGAGTRIEGHVVFSGRLRIDGEVKGDVSAAEAASCSVLYLTELGRIEGNVTVEEIVSNGNIVGAVTATKSLGMQSRARIVGDVDYSSIEMHQGAVIDGGRLLYRGIGAEQKAGSED